MASCFCRTGQVRMRENVSTEFWKGGMQLWPRVARKRLIRYDCIDDRSYAWQISLGNHNIAVNHRGAKKTHQNIGTIKNKNKDRIFQLETQLSPGQSRIVAILRTGPGAEPYSAKPNEDFYLVRPGIATALLVVFPHPPTPSTFGYCTSHCKLPLLVWVIAFPFFSVFASFFAFTSVSLCHRIQSVIGQMAVGSDLSSSQSGFLHVALSMTIWVP